MAVNASSRAADPAAAVISLDETITAENNATVINGQAITLPPLAAARARLLDLILRRPAPTSEATIVDVRRWQEKGRRGDAVRILRPIPSTTDVATALRVAPSTVRRWRAGSCSPTLRHRRQLRALRALTWARP